MRIVLALAAALLILGGVLSILKLGSNPEKASDASAVSDTEREATSRFWNHYRSGMDARRDGDWGGAVREFSAALELRPRHEDSLYYLGNALFETGEYARAAQQWSRLLETNPMATRAHIQLGQLRSCPDIEQMFDLGLARERFERALDLNPEESGPLSRLGEVELALGNDERAAELLAHARQMNPRAVTAHYLGAYLAYKSSDPAAAKRLLEAAREAIPTSRETTLPALEGDLRPGDANSRPDETMSQRRLFAPLLQHLRETNHLDPQHEVNVVESYLRNLPDTPSDAD